jgi:hypothetical protein
MNNVLNFKNISNHIFNNSCYINSNCNNNNNNNKDINVNGNDVIISFIMRKVKYYIELLIINNEINPKNEFDSGYYAFLSFLIAFFISFFVTFLFYIFKFYCRKKY